MLTALATPAALATPTTFDVVIADAFALARGLLLPKAVREAYPKLALLVSEATGLRKGGRGRRVAKRALRSKGVLGVERHIGPAFKQRLAQAQPVVDKAAVVSLQRRPRQNLEHVALQRQRFGRFVRGVRVIVGGEAAPRQVQRRAVQQQVLHVAAQAEAPFFGGLG